MNKIELNTLTQVNNNERNFLTALNDNLKRIQAAINDTLSRSGVSPNQMEEVLDMNGKRIVNVGPAVNPTDVVTRQDIQNIIDAANAAIAQLDRLVEDGKIALMNYASEYIYPTCTAAVDACQLAQRKSEDAQGAAEAARDALLLNADYQAIVANLTTILALVNDIANLDAIAADLTNIDTVAGISSAVSAVAANEANINAVNANKTNIDTVAGDKANIDTVAGNTSNINTVAGISSAVTTLAGISATLTALNNSLTAINGVYDDLSKIESVYTALPEVEAVYAALSDIGAVADALTAISSVAAALTTLANIEDNLTTLLAVGADLTNLDSIAADLTNLDSIANNLTEILQASTYASQAAASASNAQIWAEGTDQQVVPLGGQHSAKVWAQYIEEIIAGTRIYGGTFDSTTATATLTSSAKAKLGVTSDTIVLTNDSTAVTGYAANEGIEYYVAVDGTFASLTLHEGDILWSTGSAWKKIDNAATEIPDATESVKGIAYLASTAEAEAGANDTKIMTPLKTKQAILELAPAPADASTSTKGILQLANNAEAAAGSNETKAMTPETTKKAISTQTYNNLSASQRTTLLSNGTYMGDTMVTGKIFELDSGKFESFTDTVTGSSLTWSSGTLPNQTYWSNTSAYGDGTFVFATNGGSYGAAYSTNGGKTWTAATIPSGVTGSWLQTGYGNGVFVAIPESSTNALYSTDGGRTWQASTMPASDYNGLAFGGGRFIATPRNRNTGAYSDDGIHWYSLNMSSWQYWYNIAYGNNLFVAVSYLNNKAAYSADGSSWTEVSLPSASTWDTMAFGNGRFVAICSGDRKCTYSTDGGTWSDAIDLDVEVRWIRFGNGIFIGTGSDGNSVYTSSDGVTWTKSSTLSGTTWSITGAGGGYFVAIRYSYGWTNVVSSGAYVINHEYSLTPLSYTKSEVDTALAGKQGTLTAGTGINISSDTVTATAMTGADGTNAGTLGAVPAPAATDNTKFLRGDGTWAEAAQEPAYDSSTKTIQL